MTAIAKPIDCPYRIESSNDHIFYCQLAFMTCNNDNAFPELCELESMYQDAENNEDEE